MWRIDRGMIFLAVAGIITAYFFRNAKLVVSDSRGYANHVVVLLVFVALYLARRNVVAVLEAAIVSLRCRTLNNIFWWLDDFFSGKNGSISTLPALAGIASPIECNCRAANVGDASSRGGGRSQHTTDDDDDDDDDCPLHGLDSVNDLSFTSPGDHDVAMGLRVDPETRYLWQQQHDNYVHALLVYRAVRRRALPAPRSCDSKVSC